MEFASLVADLLHLLLVLPILLAPWRLPLFLRAVCEPSGRWPLRLEASLRSSAGISCFTRAPGS